jgi:hypothetical protein
VIRFRRRRVPAQVQEAVALAATERVLAAAKCDDGQHVVASDRALYLVAADADPEQTIRMRWDLIDKATWEPPVMAVDSRDAADEPVTRTVLAFQTDGELPAVVRERVTNSIVVNSQIAVSGGTARVLARRNSDDGLLQWRVVLSPGVDGDDPAVRAATEAELSDLRSRLGV